MNEEELAQKLKALSEPVRLQILRLLPDHDECEGVYNVSELAEELGLSQPTVSHHLCVLKQAGLVQKRKMCRDCYYWLDLTAIAELTDSMNLRFLSKGFDGPREASEVDAVAAGHVTDVASAAEPVDGQAIGEQVAVLGQKQVEVVAESHAGSQAKGFVDFSKL